MDWIRGPRLWIRRGREPDGVVFVVRRKLGKAVRRNRLKRRLRHICREIPLAGEGLVVLARHPAIDARFLDLRQELVELISRL